MTNLVKSTQISMIKSFIKQWLFVNYCGQKIGQFKGADLSGTLLNVMNVNISFIIYGIFLDIYILLGFRNFIVIAVIAIPFEFLVTRKLIKRYIMPLISLKELNDLYNLTPRWKRIFYFILAIIILLCSVLSFFLLIISLKFF